MKNPFENLSGEEPQQVEFEMVSGCFDCQDCFDKVYEAKYIEGVNVLTWICGQGHISKIEDFE